MNYMWSERYGPILVKIVERSVVVVIERAVDYEQRGVVWIRVRGGVRFMKRFWILTEFFGVSGGK